MVLNAFSIVLYVVIWYTICVGLLKLSLRKSFMFIRNLFTIVPMFIVQNYQLSSKSKEADPHHGPIIRSENRQTVGESSANPPSQTPQPQAEAGVVQSDMSRTNVLPLSLTPPADESVFELGPVTTSKLPTLSKDPIDADTGTSDGDTAKIPPKCKPAELKVQAPTDTLGNIIADCPKEEQTQQGEKCIKSGKNDAKVIETDKTKSDDALKSQNKRQQHRVKIRKKRVTVNRAPRKRKLPRFISTSVTSIYQSDPLLSDISQSRDEFGACTRRGVFAEGGNKQGPGLGEKNSESQDREKRTAKQGRPKVSKQLVNSESEKELPDVNHVPVSNISVGVLNDITPDEVVQETKQPAVKRKRGRPKKVPHLQSSPTTKTFNSSVEAGCGQNKSEQESAHSGDRKKNEEVVRGDGSCTGSEDKVQKVSELKKEDVESPRKRGRPRKVNHTYSHTVTAEQDASSFKPTLDSKKEDNVQKVKKEDVESPRKRGRPRKVNHTYSHTVIAEQDASSLKPTLDSKKEGNVQPVVRNFQENQAASNQRQHESGTSQTDLDALRFVYDPIVSISSRTRSSQSFDSASDNGEPQAKIAKKTKKKASEPQAKIAKKATKVSRKKDKVKRTTVTESHDTDLVDRAVSDVVKTEVQKIVQVVDSGAHVSDHEPSPEIPLQNVTSDSISSEVTSGPSTTNVAVTEVNAGSETSEALASKMPPTSHSGNVNGEDHTADNDTSHTHTNVVHSPLRNGVNGEDHSLKTSDNSSIGSNISTEPVTDDGPTTLTSLANGDGDITDAVTIDHTITTATNGDITEPLITSDNFSVGNNISTEPFNDDGPTTVTGLANGDGDITDAVTINHTTTATNGDITEPLLNGLTVDNHQLPATGEAGATGDKQNNSISAENEKSRVDRKLKLTVKPKNSEISSASSTFSEVNSTRINRKFRPPKAWRKPSNDTVNVTKPGLPPSDSSYNVTSFMGTSTNESQLPPSKRRKTLMGPKSRNSVFQLSIVDNEVGIIVFPCHLNPDPWVKSMIPIF